MDEPTIIIDGDDIIFPEDPDEYLAALQKFLTGLENNRDKFATITDQDICVLREKRDNFARSLEASRRADAALEEANRKLAESQAAYEREMQAHQTRSVQAELGKSINASKKFQD